MDEKIKLLYADLSETYNVGTIDDFYLYLQDESKRQSFFDEVIKPTYNVGSLIDFENAYGLKKKDETVTESVLDTGFSVQPEVGAEVEITTPEVQETEKVEYEPYTSINAFSRPTVEIIEAVEEPTAIERQFGKNTITNFVGDLYRAASGGLAQGATIDDAMNVWAMGSEVSNEDLNEYIRVVEEMESKPVSNEMQEFYEIYDKHSKEGNGVMGFVLGVGDNPSVIPELFTSSIFAMLNPTVAAGAATGALGGAAIGAGAGAIGGPLAGATATGGAIMGAIGGMSGTLEGGLAFTEFLKEEISEKGLKFNEEGIRKTLKDEEAINRITNKALARGVSIALIDAMSGGLATSVTRKAAMKSASKLVGGAAGATVEAIGGSTGEAVARAVTGQKMDTADILFEGIVGTATAPLTVTRGLIKAPVYKIGNEVVTRKKLQTVLETATPSQISKIDFDVKNDPDLKSVIQEKRTLAIIEHNVSQANPELTINDKAKVIELELKKQKLIGNDTVGGKEKVSNIDNQIKEITSKYEGIEVFSTKEEAVAALNEEGITKPTDFQILKKLDDLNTEKLTKKEKDAFQKSSTEKVDVSKQSTDGKGVGDGDTQLATETTSKEKEDNTSDTKTSDEVQVDTEVRAEWYFSLRTRGGTTTDGYVLTGKEAELEERRIQKEADRYKKLGKDPENLVLKIVNRLGLEQNSNEMMIDWIEGYVRGEITTPFAEYRKGPQSETKITEKEKLKKVTKEKVKKLVTAPRRITEPFKIGQTTVVLNEDGTIQSAVNSKKKPVSEKILKKIQKKVLENVIDIDAGKKAPTTESLQPEQAGQYIADESSNVREVAEAIQAEETKIKEAKELSEKIKTEDQGLFSLIDLAFTPDSWKRVTGLPPSENISSRWIRTKEKGGIALEDGVNGLNASEIVNFVTDNPTPTDIVNSTGQVSDKNNLISLQEKFKKLTGIKATPSIIDFVLNIEQGRMPLDLLKTIEKEQLSKPALDEKGRVIEGGAFGKKKGPSAKKITSTPKKEITVDESSALKDQIRLEAKAAREAKLDIKKKRALIAALIKEMKAKGTISRIQAIVLARKTLLLNVDSPIKVEQFIEYTDKIFKNAEIAEKLNESEKFRKNAKKNIKKKIGSSKELFPVLEALFNINPASIPLDKIDAYYDLVKAFGAKKAILSLPESGLVLKQAEDIINSIEEQSQVDEEKTVKEDDYNLKEEIDNILKNRVEIPDLLAREKETAEYLNSLSREDIEDLVTEKDGKKNYSQIEKLKNVLDNIENGYVPQAAYQLETIISGDKSAKIIKSSLLQVTFKKLEQGLSRAVARVKDGFLKGESTTRGAVKEQIRAQPLTNVDESIGRFNKKEVSRETFDYAAEKMSNYQKAFADIENKLMEVEGFLSKGKIKFSKRLANEIIKSKYKITLFQLQREFNSNNGKKGTSPGINWIDATIKAIKSEEVNYLTEQDIKILTELKEEFLVDGQIDENKIQKSFTENEKKALVLLDEVNQSLAEPTMIASVVRGNRVSLFNNYVHHEVIRTNEETIKYVNEKRDKFSQPSAKSDLLIERTEGAKPISFDPISTAQRAAKETLLDFYMTQPIRRINRALSQSVKNLKADPNATKLQISTALALQDAFKEVNEIIFDNTYQEIGLGDKLMNEVKRIGYYAALASVPRAAAEYSSNMVFALTTNPLGAARGIKNYAGFSMLSEGAGVLDAIGSMQTLKLYDKASMTGKFTEKLLKSGLNTRGKATNRFSEMIDYLYHNIPIIKGPVEATKFISEKLISTPDKAISRPLYFDTFIQAFKEATKKSGKEIILTVADLKEMATGKSKYLTENKAEIKEARQKADDENVRMATTTNPYSGILKLQIKKNDSGFIKAYKTINSYMATFNLFEYSTFRKGVRALYHSGELSRPEAMGLMAGATARMTSYMLFINTFYTIFDSMLRPVVASVLDYDVKEDDDEEEELTDQLYQQLVGSGATLMLRRGLGNLPAIPINLGIEYLNKEFGGELRSQKEYDGFENSLVFSQIGLNDFKNKTPEEIGAKIIGGPFTPFIKSLSRGYKVVKGATQSKKEETKDRYIRELTERMAIEALGNMAVLPFYKDIRRAYLKDFFTEKKATVKPKVWKEEDFKNAKGNPVRQSYIRKKITEQKNKRSKK